MKVAIGTIVRAHGVRGWVRARAEGDGLLTVQTVEVAGQPRRIVELKPEHEGVLLKLEGIDDRDQADALRGEPLWTEREALPPLQTGELYAADLVGCEVFDAAGKRLGVVKSTFPGAQEILEVEGDASFMLPLVEPIVTAVDVAARRIVCDPPPGLINLDEADSDR